MINTDLKIDEAQSDGIITLAVALSSECDFQTRTDERNLLSLEETGAAEELLALASEASLSNPLNREMIITPTVDTLEQNGNAENEKYVLGARKRVCSNCSVTSTPFWRKSSVGLYYCNACGLYLRTHNIMRPLNLTKNREIRRSKTRPDACENCGATDTPMWRKSSDGLMVCNACGLYHKLHSQHRSIRVRRNINTQPTKLITSDFRLVRENEQINSIVEKNFLPIPAVAKYSLDPQFHHKFDPNQLKQQKEQQKQQVHGHSQIKQHYHSISLPLIEPQPIDARKLAFLTRSQGRTALLAPKSQLPPALKDNFEAQQINSQKTFHHHQNAHAPVMPPILNDFIQSLATTSAGNLTPEQVDHPLQSILTNIVSKKLKQQRKSKTKNYSSSTTPTTTSCSLGSNNLMNQTQMPVLEDFHKQLLRRELIYNHHNQQQQQSLSEQQLMYLTNDSNIQSFQDNSFQKQQFPHNYQNLQSQLPQHYQQHHNNTHVHPFTQTTGTQRQTGGEQESFQHRLDPQIFNQHFQLPSLNYSEIHPHYLSPPPPPSFPQILNPNQNHHNQVTDRVNLNVPSRQLSPFSGMNFDKNLIDLVNMQFWQDNNQENENQNNQQNL